MMDIKTLSEWISHKSSLSPGDVQATLIALVDEIPGLLLDNYSVKLGDLGIFSAYLNGTPADSEKELTFRNIKNVKIKFRPGKGMKKELKLAKFKKV